MSQGIDQFRENLREKFTNIEKDLRDLIAKIDEKAQNAEQEVRSHGEKLLHRMWQDRAKVAAAQAEMNEWVEARKIATSAEIAEWKAKRETSRLQMRADQAERYEVAAMTVALAAIDEAEHAALEAWLARQDAVAAQAKIRDQS